MKDENLERCKSFVNEDYLKWFKPIMKEKNLERYKSFLKKEYLKGLSI
jgi:hypothetical protein